MEVSAHSDQSRWLIGINMDMGIKGSNNEPRAQIKWHERACECGIMQHDKNGSDSNGTIEDTATKRTTLPSRIMPGSVVLDPDIRNPPVYICLHELSEVHR